jgi:hypothetical protein
MEQTTATAKAAFLRSLKRFGKEASAADVVSLPEYFSSMQKLADAGFTAAKQNGHYAFTLKGDAVGGDGVSIETGSRIENLRNAYKKVNLGAGRKARILRVSALSVEAIWVHEAANPQKDVFIPFYSSVQGIRALETYQRGEFTSLVDALVHFKLAHPAILPL